MVYRAAVIGCGRIGSELADDPRATGVCSHAQAYTICPETELVAVCDCDPEKVEQCARRWGVGPRYHSFQQMLAEQRPEIVSICTPDATHYQLVREAIMAPGVRAVLAEKPLATEVAEARRLVELAKERSVIMAVNYSRRFAASHIRLKEYLQQGGIGQVQTLGGYYTKGIFHNGTHWIDLARFLIGEVVRVWGFNPRHEHVDDPTLDAYMEFESGPKAHLQGCDDASFSLFEMDLIGTEGRVHLTEYGQVFKTYTVEDSQYYTGYKSLTQVPMLEGGLVNAMLTAVEDLTGCLGSGRQPRCSGWDGVAAMQIASAVASSARSGQSVAM